MTKKKQIDPRRKEVRDYIAQHPEQTLPEVGKALGVSVPTLWRIAGKSGRPQGRPRKELNSGSQT